jgi:hypothetical protein
MIDWKKEQKDKQKENLKLAKQVQEQLVWENHPITGRIADSCGFGIRFDNGMGISIHTQDANKFKVHCIWPIIEHKIYGPEDKKIIYVSKNRGVKGLVRDISNKLLVYYEERFKAQIERANIEIDQQNKLEQAIREIVQLDGNEPSEMELRTGQIRYYKNFSCNIHVVDFGDDGINIKIDTEYMPIENGKKLIKFMSQLHKKEV